MSVQWADLYSELTLCQYSGLTLCQYSVLTQGLFSQLTLYLFRVCLAGGWWLLPQRTSRC